MKHLKTFESYVTSVNEGNGDTVARQYGAELVSDLDMDEIYLSDEGLDKLNDILRSSKYGGNNKVYMTNKAFIEEEGKDWNALVQLVKSKNLKSDLIEDEEDTLLLFSR